MPRKSKNGIDLQEYGAVCQRITSLESRVEKFIENEFHHVSNKVDRLFFAVIAALMGLAANLVVLILK